MRAICTQHAIALAAEIKGPFAKIAKAAIEAGIIVPSILKTGLEKAGYVVTYFDGPKDTDKPGKAKVGAWVRVFSKKGEIAARAYSHDEADALLQAVYAAMKEEEAAEKAAKAPHSV